MITQPLVPRPGRRLTRRLASIAVALLLVVGLLLAAVFLPPVGAPLHVLNAPSAAASQAVDKGVAGTLASFTALIPEMVTVYLPNVAR
jgi:hypothetical protein